MQLEKGYLPQPNSRQNNTKYGWIKDIENGDSFLVDDRSAANSIVNTVRARNNHRKTDSTRRHIRPQTQTQIDGGVRIWFWIEGEGNDS